MKLMKMLRNAALAVLLLSAGVANAAIYQFNLTGAYTASWQLNSTVSPDDSADGIGFVIWDVAGSFPGAILGVADLYFYNSAIDGGLEIYDFYNDTDLLLTDGPQLYTGPEDAPTFLLGSFALTDFDGPGTYLLTVTEVGVPPPAGVPEPASGVLVVGGLVLLYASRKRRNA